MATLHPPYALDPDHVATASGRTGVLRERETLQLLAATLPASYAVFHSTHLAWLDDAQHPRKREADFLVVNQAGEVLMIEQKTGALELTEAGLLMKSYGGPAKNVVTQCHEITDALRSRYHSAYGRALTISMLLYCPDHIVGNQAIAGLAAEQILDARGRRGLVRRVRTLLPEGKPDPERRAQVHAMLSQTLHLAPDVATQAAAGERVLTRLTDGLLGFLTALEMTPWRLRLNGTAGCGKTQMVTTFAERWQAGGRRVLVACYNRPLADELRQALPPDIVVETIHGIARRLLEGSGRTVDFAAQANVPDLWPRLLAEATDAALVALPADWQFDALIVDEGQDVDQAGYDMLRLLVPARSDVVWLEDDDQRLYPTAPFAEGGFVTYRCRDNYRSPQRVARFLAALLPIPFIARNPAPGDAVRVQEVASADLLAALDARIAASRAAGYQDSQIVVLTGRGQAGSTVLGTERLGGSLVRRFAGFAADGTACHTPGELRIETLWRFKGQQAPVIVICELDGDLVEEATQRCLYCAATRASARLEILVPRGSALVAPLHRAAGQANAASLG